MVIIKVALKNKKKSVPVPLNAHHHTKFWEKLLDRLFETLYIWALKCPIYPNLSKMGINILAILQSPLKIDEKFSGTSCPSYNL